MNIKPFLEADLAIQVHMIAAICAFFLGAFVLWRRKGNAAHKRNGRIWVGLMMITALSGFFIHEIRVWGDYSPIHIISALVPIGLIYSVLEARRGDINAHRFSMKSTYVGGMLVAGGFTFLPGRLNYEIFIGEADWSVITPTSWIFSIAAAALIFAYYTWRIRQNANSN